MTGSIDSGLSQGYATKWVKVLLRLSFVFLLMNLLGCETIKSHIPYFNKKDTPQQAVPVEDPALSTDPTKQPKGPLQWTWQDPVQRWDYTGKLSPIPTLQIDGWVFEASAVKMRIVATPQLNTFQKLPHAMLLKVFQLADPKAFKDRRELGFGLQEMLKNDAFDPSVLAVSQYSLLPGSDQVVSFDRQLNARYIAVVAGYYGLDGKLVSRIVPVPVMNDSVQGGGWLHDLSMGYLGQADSTVPPRPAKLKMVLQLGADKIDRLRVFVE